MGSTLAQSGIGCRCFHGVPPSAIGFSIILLILTYPPHASVRTSILGESDGRLLPWMSLLLPSVGGACCTSTPPHRMRRPWLRFPCPQAQNRLAAVAARYPIWAADTYLAGPKASSWCHVHQTCSQYRPPGSCDSRGSCITHAASTGTTSNWPQKQNGLHQNCLTPICFSPRGEPRSLISRYSRAC
jgi:hypothetical protein